jgi:soluble lytic murein transglycosylase-like protein
VFKAITTGVVLVFALVGVSTVAALADEPAAMPQPTQTDAATALRAQLALERREHAAEVRRLRRVFRTADHVRAATAVAAIAYDVPVQELRAVARCESRSNPAAVARTTIWNGERARGLLQIVPSTFARTPYAGLDVMNPYVNAAASAWIVARDGGWRQWAKQCRP